MKHINKTSVYQQVTSEILKESKTRIQSIMNESILPTKRKRRNKNDIAILSLDEAINLTKTNKKYFLTTIQMMVDLLRLQYNREYIEDFGNPPRSANYTFEYDKNLQELRLFVSLKIKGISNNFLFQTSTTFRLDNQNKIVKAIGDEYLYMLAIYGRELELHSKNDIKGIINSLSGSSNRTAKKIYKDTIIGGPARGRTAIETQSNDNTIRL